MKTRLLAEQKVGDKIKLCSVLLASMIDKMEAMIFDHVVTTAAKGESTSEVG
jgi:hypothetical protein